MLFFISINNFKMLETEIVPIKFFSRIFMKLAFTNVPFRHNFACVIQKWIKFKRFITLILAYTS